MKLLATTKEKYSRIETPNHIFMDSFAHLPDSLAKLTLNLKDKGSEQFDLVRKEFPENSKFNVCLQKLIYPYTYMDSFEKFDEPIPGPEMFYNDLSDEHVSEDEYERLIKICKLFKINTLGELHDLYLKIDVLILGSVFEFYRNMALTQYGLDPVYYVSAPSFSFDAMLFKTKVELELLQDAEMYNFIESGMRGGISSIYKRFVTANCSDSENFNPHTDPKTLFYAGM